MWVHHMPQEVVKKVPPRTLAERRLLLIFCIITPKFIIIPGTSREDYANMKYHLVSGAKGLVISVVASALFAAVMSI